MSRPTRLFDCIDIQQSSPKSDLLSYKKDGVYQHMDTAEVHRQVLSLTAGLLAKGISAHDMTVEGRDKIGIVSNSRPEWLITDLAVQQTGAILVPLYPNIVLKDLEGIFNEAEVKICFVSSKELYDQLKEAQASIPSLQGIYSFDKIPGVPHWEDLHLPVTSDTTQNIRSICNDIQGSDVATIIYTSGTTGKPKGVMLTHDNIVSNVLSVTPTLEGIEGMVEKRALSFLPLNHIFEKMIAYVYLFNGFSIYYAESMDTIGDNLKEAKPYVFVTVPRLIEKVYERIMATGQQLKGIKRALFFWAIGLGTQYDPSVKGSWWYRLQLSIANKLVFSKWRAALGGNVKAIVVGGAACQLRLAKIFSAAEVTIMEGYGLTETSPVIAVNSFDRSGRRLGTVGRVIDGVHVRIAEDGEILCKGPNIMKGYYKQPEATADAVKDGWFATGDIGELQEGGYLKITDRKKELFKTSGGKYVAPQPIENKLKENRFIEQVMLVGPERKFVGALVVPAFPALKAWMKSNELTYSTNEAAVAEPKVQAMYQEIIDRYNPNFSHVEQVKKFVLLPAEWSIDSGELTPKLSMKRKIITEKYLPQIDSMYAV